MRGSRPKIAALVTPVKRTWILWIAPLALMVVYIGLFSYWWLSAKKTVAIVNGSRQIVIEVPQSDFMHHTQPVWNPAFWFMENIAGYRYAGYIAGMENSAFVYEK